MIQKYKLWFDFQKKMKIIYFFNIHLIRRVHLTDKFLH